MFKICYCYVCNNTTTNNMMMTVVVAVMMMMISLKYLILVCIRNQLNNNYISLRKIVVIKLLK